MQPFPNVSAAKNKQLIQILKSSHFGQLKPTESDRNLQLYYKK